MLCKIKLNFIQNDIKCFKLKKKWLLKCVLLLCNHPSYPYANYILIFILSSVQSFSCVQLFGPHELQNARLHVLHRIPELAQIHIH